MGDIQQLISNLGFPIFITLWLLVKSSKDSKDHTDALKEHTSVIVELKNAIKLMCFDCARRDSKNGN
jgi:hypothetical protein